MKMRPDYSAYIGYPASLLVDLCGLAAVPGLLGYLRDMTERAKSSCRYGLSLGALVYDPCVISWCPQLLQENLEGIGWHIAFSAGVGSKTWLGWNVMFVISA